MRRARIERKLCCLDCFYYYSSSGYSIYKRSDDDKSTRKISNTGYRGVRDSTVSVEIVVVSIEDDNKY